MKRKLRKLKRTVSRAVILPYKIGSRSAKLLAQELTNKLGLKVRRVRHDGNYRPKSHSLVVNYGSAAAPKWVGGAWLQNPSNVSQAGNKLTAFRAFKEANLAIPDFTTSMEEAKAWIASGGVAVCRTLLNSHSGRGIVLSDGERPLVQAPLYVKYKKKRKEFRVHVFKGQTIDVAEKRKRRVDRDTPFDGYVRNLANGWVYCRGDVVRPHDLDGLAVAACNALGLDFGAVDIIWNEHENKSYLLEVNTAPGLEGTTLVNYTNAIYNWIQNQR